MTTTDGDAGPPVPVAPDAGGPAGPEPHAKGPRRSRFARYRAGPRPPLGPVRRGLREAGLGLITAGVIVLLFVLYQLVGTNFAEEHSQANLAKQFKAEVAKAASSARTATAPPAIGGSHSASGSTGATTTTVPAASPPAGGALYHLEIPKIGVNKYVVEGVAENDLDRGPGHYTGTAQPGQLGNVGIAGHRTTYGAPFFRLNELSAGDPIYLTTLSGATYTYDVTSSEVVSPSDVAVLNPTPAVAQLTLTTCNPRFEATNRLVVFARLAPNLTPAPATPAPASRSKSIAVGAAAADTANLGSGNSAAWPAVIAYGAVVLAAWVLVRLSINRTRRWARLGAYVVGIGICLIPLWFLFENVTRLLPQNI